MPLFGMTNKSKCKPCGLSRPQTKQLAVCGSCNPADGVDVGGDADGTEGAEGADGAGDDVLGGSDSLISISGNSSSVPP
jgi:hypothetical protein